MSRKLRVTLAQLNPTVGDIEGNAAKILDVWQKHDKDSDLVVFPELFLSGYPPEDLVLNVNFRKRLRDKVSELCEKTKKFQSAAIIPTPWETEDKRIINAFLLVQSGEIKAVQAKVKLPNYGVFDEIRTFSPGSLPEPLTVNGVKIGFLICEDLWHDEPALHLKEQGAEILIAINGSPYFYRQMIERKKIADRCVKNTGLCLIYLNMVGGQDELVFEGRSFILHPQQKFLSTDTDFAPHSLFCGLAFQEEVFQTTISFEKASEKSERTIVIFDEIKGGTGNENYSEFVDGLDDYTYPAITLGLQDYVRKNGFSKVLLGLSGGIDSALVAAIAVDALGAENVRAIMLPSEFTSKESLEDAKECARNLRIKYEIIPIEEAVKTFEKIIPDLKGLAHENTQSRIRGLILMALSNISGEMLLSTGNKSELATGYATLYGDMNGGYNPLKDLYKQDVYNYAQLRSTVIPERIFTKAPSAELRPDQTDEQSLLPYEILDHMLMYLIEGVDIENYYHALYEALDIGHRDDDLSIDTVEVAQWVEKISKLLRSSEFKRFQACPGPRVSSSHFGKDRRYPLTNKFVSKIAD